MKKPLRIKIREKEFVIEFVNNWFCINYYEYKLQTVEVDQAYVRSKQIQAQAEACKTGPDKTHEEVQAEIKTLAAEMNALGAKVNKIATKEFYANRMALVKEALTSNNQPFEEKWWERRTSPADIIGFLDDVYAYETGTLKKKEEVVRR